MIHMLCRNRVEDYDRWKRVFDSDPSAHREAGLELVALWRSLEDPNDIHFLFEVESVERARAFVEAPESAEAGKEAGVVDGEIHFLEPVPETPR